MRNDVRAITAEPQWSTTQQTFLDLLQDVENQPLSKLDLCRKAGFAFAGPWYTAIKDPEFKAAVKALYTEGERHRLPAETQAPQWNRSQQKLLDLLQVEANRQLTIAELCEKAGLPNFGYWYRAIEHPQFKATLQSLGIEVERRRPHPDTQVSIKGPPWGRVHQQLLEVLQVEANRQLSITELCQKAGFASKNAWYRALEHPQFKETVEGLGVAIERTGINAPARPSKVVPQWSDMHQTLLDLLQVEANRQLSITELCQKAGFADRTYWYRALKHPQLREAVEALGIVIERYELSWKGQTRAERELLKVLQVEANRTLSIVEICRQAGYTDDYWYKSLKSDDFVQALQMLGIEPKRREYNENGWTEVQQNLLDVLQEPANHQLSLTELCQKAGYPDCTYWFRALKSQRFIAAVEAIGIEIWWHGRNANGHTRAQQRFLALLQEQPVTTAGALCRRAGYTNTSVWTQVLQDQHFVATLETLDIQVERVERRQDGWTWGQKHLLAVLEREANRNLPVVEICRLAGYTNKLWYGALRRPVVLAAIQDLHVRIPRCGPDEHGWTWAQQRLLQVLQEEANRQLSIIELCAQAGYSDLSRWYESLASEQFVETLQAWGVPIERQKPPFMPHIHVRLTMNLEADLNQDVWDMRQFKPEYPKHRSPAQYIVDFTCIQNPQLRQQVKGFFRRRLPKWQAGTFAAQLQTLRGVLVHLPSDVDIETITRAHIEEVLPVLLAQSSDSWAKSCLRAARSMFHYMAHSRYWDGPRPPQDLIDREDIPSAQTPLPRPIPVAVLDQLDPLLAYALQEINNGCEPPLLEPIFWDAILLLRRTGMRFADLAHLEAPMAHNRGGCLGQDGDGDWWIHIRPETTKMRREHQIPTRAEDGIMEAIRRQTERVQSIPDHFGKAYLFRTEQGVLTYKAFCKALGKLSPYLICAGQPYEITPHQFRHTIATDMINEGVELILVKEFLGHASLAMTMRYVKVYRAGLQAKYQAYRARTSQQNLFTPLPIQFLGQRCVPLNQMTSSLVG
jgi:site-specific recombinase XerD/AraC-like DNA-binding protein